MWKLFIVITCLIGYCATGPLGSKHHVRFKARQNRDAPLAEAETAISTSTSSSSTSAARLNLPSNATSIRAEIKDGFSCEGRVYGYYADMENDCQIFHVCMPVAYGDGKEHYFRWSFICPEDTIFSQDSFTCMHRQDMLIDCADSMKYYELNRNFGQMNDDSAANAHRNSPEPQAAASENDNEAENTSVEENITPKPVKKTKPFHRKPVRTSNFAQKPKKPQATEVEPAVKVKRPAAAVYKRNKPQILRDRTTEEPVKEVPTTQATIKVELNTEANSEVLLDTLESTTAQLLAEEPLATSTLPTLTEEEENFLKQTAGGFQEVDPTMAAEAEALINDFLQTMMKTETQPAAAPLDVPVPVPVPDSASVPEEEEAVVQEVADFSQTTLAPIRSDMYEIPVTIIHTPLEEIMAEKPQPESVELFRPISIDDVVKSVKEHLDKPVEAEVIAADSTDSLKPTSEVNSENVEIDEKIVPIYHRLKADQDNVAKPEMISVEAINDLTQTADKSETESQSTNNPENAN